MDDNPLVSRLYLTGVFYFILMYTGSNVLPITRFLKATHLKQAFKADCESIKLRSILATALPEAMVHYLDNYTEEKFSEIYLAEFNTPEAIWNAGMRRMMIEKLAGHIADFTPSLRYNARAIYQFVPLPKLEYPQLENELFVHIYYLKHLCDSVKFPNWPIKNPVVFLKELLLAWKLSAIEKVQVSIKKKLWNCWVYLGRFFLKNVNQILNRKFEKLTSKWLKNTTQIKIQKVEIFFRK